MSKKDAGIEDQMAFLIASRNLKCEKKEKWAYGIDFTTSDVISDEKTLVRTIEPRGKTSFVDADDVKSMLKVMRRKDCRQGIIIAKKFTDAATKEMNLGNIQQFSDDCVPISKPENIAVAINDCVENLCRTRCGAIPLNDSECENRVKEIVCRVKSIRDDSLFHLERGWLNLVKNDLRQLLLIQ